MSIFKITANQFLLLFLKCYFFLSLRSISIFSLNSGYSLLNDFTIFAVFLNAYFFTSPDGIHMSLSESFHILNQLLHHDRGGEVSHLYVFLSFFYGKVYKALPRSNSFVFPSIVKNVYWFEEAFRLPLYDSSLKTIFL